MKRLTLSAAISAVLFSQLSQAQQLDSIIVSANNLAQPLKTVTGSAVVITQQEIEDKQYQTLQQALESVPGVNFYNNGGMLQATNIQMRGSSTGQVLIMLDGVSINDPSGFGANLNSIALQNVKRIEVVKGPQAGVWGANAAAGVINIISKDAKQTESAQFTFERGSNNTQKMATTLSGSDEHADFVFSISDLSSDGYSTVKAVDEDATDPEKDGYSQTDINFKLGINLAKQHRLEALLNKSMTNNNYDAYAWPAGFDANDTFSNTEMDSELRRLQYQFEQPGLSVRLYASDYQINRTSSEPFVTGVYKGQTKEKGGVVNFEYQPNQTLTAGLNLAETKGKSDFYGVSEAQFESTGLFISNSNQFNNGRLIITESLRRDQYDNDFDDKTTGKIGIKNHFNDNFYLSAQYGTAYNAPSLYAYTHSVANLQPESTEGYEINLGAYGLELSYYRNEITDLIGYNTDFLAYNESGTSTLSGIEVSYSRYLDELNTDLYVSYDRLSAKNSDDQWLGRRPESQASLHLTYDGISKTLIGLQTRYIGRMYDQNNQAGAKIGDFFSTNLTADYAVNAQFSVYARVINVFDQDGVSAVANYEDDYLTAKDVYSNGGVQYFVGIRGQL